MPYFKDCDLLFIHIPKTGGSNIENFPINFSHNKGMQDCPDGIFHITEITKLLAGSGRKFSIVKTTTNDLREEAPEVLSWAKSEKKTEGNGRKVFGPVQHL